jgi:hypothetical protein
MSIRTTYWRDEYRAPAIRSRGVTLALTGVLAATVVIRPTTLCAQHSSGSALTIDTVGRFDWQRSEFRLTKVPRAGRASVVLITGLNDACYSYTISGTNTEAKTEVVDLSALGLVAQKLGTESVQKADAAPKVPAPDTTTRDGQNLLAHWTATNGALPNPLTSKYPLIKSALDAAQSALNSVRDKLTATDNVLARARAAIEAYQQAACNGGLRPIDSTLRAETAEQAAQAADAFLHSEFAVIETELTRAETNLKAANATISGLTVAEQLEVARAFAEQGGYNRLIKIAHDDGTILTELRSILAKAIAAVPAIQRARASAAAKQGLRDQVLTISPTQTTESIEETIVATGNPAMPGMKDVKHTDKFTLQVYRPHRFFLTTGALMSFLDSHRYERTNRLTPVGDTLISTFVDRAGRGPLVFAPAAMAHMSLGRVRDVDFLATFGAAARSVNNRTLPEYVFGLSMSISDKIVFTTGAHLGRVEQLLLGEASSIAAKAVPKEITRDDAVGERWQRKLAFVVSLHP